MLFKTIATIMICAGTVSVLNGIALPVLASTSCNGSTPSPGTECDPAHEVFKVFTQNLDVSCVLNGSNCQPTPASKCGITGGYQHAGKGLCVVTMETSGDVSCTEDAYSTFIPMHHYTTFCGIKNGNCTCVYIKTEGQPTQYSEVCDCSS